MRKQIFKPRVLNLGLAGLGVLGFACSNASGDLENQEAREYGLVSFKNQGGESYTFAYQKGIGWYWRAQNLSSTQRFALDGSGPLTQAQTEEMPEDEGGGGGPLGGVTDIGGDSGGGGGATFEASFESGSFSGATADPSAFSGAVSESSGFEPGFGTSDGFSIDFGGGSLGAASCDLSILCDFFGLMCQGNPECELAMQTCESEINSAQIPSELEPLVCAFINLITCLVDNVDMSAGFEGLDPDADPAFQGCLIDFMQVVIDFSGGTDVEVDVEDLFSF